MKKVYSMLKTKRFWHFFYFKIEKSVGIALGGVLGRHRHSGISLQKERGMALQRKGLLIFLFPSLLIVLKGLRVIQSLIAYECHDYSQQLVLDIVQCN